MGDGETQDHGIMCVRGELCVIYVTVVDKMANKGIRHWPVREQFPACWSSIMQLTLPPNGVFIFKTHPLRYYEMAILGQRRSRDRQNVQTTQTQNKGERQSYRLKQNSGN